jgi:type VI protein secretion system component Hcp
MKSQPMFAGILILVAAQLAHAGAITCSLNPAVPGTAGVNVQANDLFDVDDFSFDIKNPPSAAEQNPGTPASLFNSLHITKNVDALSSMIFEMAVDGASFQSVNCTVNGAPSAIGAAPSSGFTATLSNATIIAYKVAKTADGKPKETVTLNFTKIQVSYSK